MLSVLKTEQDLQRLEKSGRLLRRGFATGLHQVAAFDVGDKLRLARPQDAAEHFENLKAAWASIDEGLDARLRNLALVGSTPFWFLDCEDWPSSAFLAAPGFWNWTQTHMAEDRPLMAACFSAEQLLLGFADSAEFHDRLGHAREAPTQRPLGPLPFLLTTTGLSAIAQIQLHLGECVRMLPKNTTLGPYEFTLR